MLNSLELIKLLFIVLIPLWLIVTKRHSALLLWIGATLGIEVLNVNIFANVRPINVVGLFCLPTAVRLLPKVLSTRIGKLIRANLVLLTLLGLIYGFSFPWPDTSGVRPLNQLPQGRTVIYLIRTIADLSVALYVAHQVQNPDNINKLLRYLLVGTTIAAVGVLLQWVTRTDVFAILAPSVRKLDWIATGRMRGLNGEPRTSGQLCAAGILLLMGLKRLGWRRIPLLVVHTAGLALTVARSGLIILVAGVILLVATSALGRLRTVLLIATVLVLGFLPQSIVSSNIIETWPTRFAAYFERFEHAGSLRNLGEAIADKLEVFDASAVLFLWDNPEHLLVGVGPGLISLPASDYVPSWARAIYGYRIDSVPHMGFFLTLANTGIVGLLLWFATALACYRALRRKVVLMGTHSPWVEARSFFVVFSGVYLLQAKPIWYIFLGLGLGAYMSLQAQQPQKAHGSLAGAEARLQKVS